MAILALSFLQALSFHGAEELLLQEGYVEEKCIEKDDGIRSRMFLYPYSLYDGEGRKLDCIYYVEYCNQVIDDEYIDGRLVWEGIRAEWKREER